MPPALSILIATYNMAGFLPEAINSVLRQSFLDFELVIIDDGSTDATRNVIKQFKKRSKQPIQYEKIAHCGKAGAINHLLQKHVIQGDYLVFMDADDLLPPHSLARRYETITSTEAEMVLGEFAVTSRDGAIQERRKLPRDANSQSLMNKFFFAPKTPFHLNSLIISKQLAGMAGYFDESLNRGQEVDYAIRLLQKSSHVHTLREIVYHYRKYRRPMQRRLKTRFAFMYYRSRILKKHLKGMSLAAALVQQFIFNSLKLIYEVACNIKRTIFQ